jgi:hypothetical protein
MRGALFVTDQDMVDGKLAQRVVHRENRPAGVSEDILYALTRQRGPHDFCAGEAGRCGEVGVGGLRI